MAYTGRTQSRSKDRITEVSLEEFKKWLKKFDFDNDGRIDAAELRDAIRAAGGWFSKVKAGRILKSADADRNGFVDDNEINKLAVFAHKFGYKIVA